MRRVLKDEQDFAIWRRKKLRSNFNLQRRIRKESEVRDDNQAMRTLGNGQGHSEDMLAKEEKLEETFSHVLG